MSHAYSYPPAATLLDHALQPFFFQLRAFRSTGELGSSPLYARLRSEIERVLGGVLIESFGRAPSSVRPSIRVSAWNIERGLKVDGIVRVLQRHPVLKESDIFLLTELDYGMVRTGNRFVAREIAEAVGLRYAFAPCYLNLEKGSGLEKRLDGDNTQALHGNALFSRYPLSDVHSIALPNGKDKMKGKEKRLGCQRAVVATVAHPLGKVRAVTLHLDAHSSQKHRRRQMKIVLDSVETLRPRLPVVIGGDWNTTTYNSSRALYSILGYCRRVVMGVRNVVHNHYPHPDRWFERRLFGELKRRGYEYHNLNKPGACTLHYDVRNLTVNESLADWVPLWCFWFIRWALKRVGGRCSLKLDWFAGKGIEAAQTHPPCVIEDLEDPDAPLSDHDPIVLDFVLSAPDRFRPPTG